MTQIANTPGHRLDPVSHRWMSTETGVHDNGRAEIDALAREHGGHTHDHYSGHTAVRILGDPATAAHREAAMVAEVKRRGFEHSRDRQHGTLLVHHKHAPLSLKPMTAEERAQQDRDYRAEGRSQRMHKGVRLLIDLRRIPALWEDDGFGGRQLRKGVALTPAHPIGAPVRVVCPPNATTGGYFQGTIAAAQFTDYGKVLYDITFGDIGSGETTTFHGIDSSFVLPDAPDAVRLNPPSTDMDALQKAVQMGLFGGSVDTGIRPARGKEKGQHQQLLPGVVHVAAHVVKDAHGSHMVAAHDRHVELAAKPVEKPHEPAKTEEPQEYRYGAQNRPPAFASPKGALRVDPAVPGIPQTRHGVVVYDRKLTEDDVKSYELSPHVPKEEAVASIASGLEYAQEHADDAREDGQGRDRLVGTLHQAIHEKGIHSDIPTAELAQAAADEVLRRLPKVAEPEPAKPPEPFRLDDLKAKGKAEVERVNAEAERADAQRAKEAEEALTEVEDIPDDPEGPAGPVDNSGRRVHHDVGEKVAGAKKDKWAQIHSGNLGDLEAQGERFAATACTKDAVLGETSGELDQALGSSPGAAYLKRELRRMISSKPTEVVVKPQRGGFTSILDEMRRPGGTAKSTTLDPAATRAAYVEGVEWLREAMDGCKTEKDMSDLRAETQWLCERGDYDEDIPVTEAVGQDFHARFGLADGDWGGSSTSITMTHPDGTTVKEPDANGKMQWKQLRLDSDKLARAGYRVFHGPNGNSIRKLAARSAPYKTWFAAMGPRINAVFGAGAHSSSSLETWHKHLAEGRRRDKANDWTGLLASTTAAREPGRPMDPRLDVHKEIGMRRMRAKVERIGGTPLPPAVDGGSLAGHFGLRAVQYGNWIDDNKAGKHLEAAHGALSDLADIIGVEPKMLAHGSKLALAFGARGSGSANAHYETGEQIINLTATRGGGTLAHEWGHFMDNVLPGTENPRSFGSHGGGEHRQMHPKVQSAYGDVMDAITRGDGSHRAVVKSDQELKEMVGEIDTTRRRVQAAMARARGPGGDVAAAETLRTEFNAKVAAYNVAQKEAFNAKHGTRYSKFLSDAKHLGDYWKRPHELFARAFESYVEDKLENGQRRNTYLVTGTREPMSLSKTTNNVTKTDLDTYPRGTEREHINRAFDGFFDALRATGALRKALGMLPMLKAVPRGTPVFTNPTDATARFDVAGCPGLHFELRKSAGGVMTMTVTGGTLALPYHLVVNGRADAMRKAPEVGASLLQGRPYKDGVFRRDIVEPSKYGTRNT